MSAIMAITKLTYGRMTDWSGFLISEMNENNALLARVERLLTDASNSYTKRQYQAAIDHYLQAESLIYAHLDPGQTSSRFPKYIEAPRDPTLFPSLLTAALGWMNILPMPGPISPVRPVDPVPDPGALLRLTGLGTTALSSMTDRAAAVDVRQAEILVSQGNVDAAKIFSTRAEHSSPLLFHHLSPAQVAGVPETGPSAATLRQIALAMQGRQASQNIGVSATREVIPPEIAADRTLGLVVGGGVRATVQTIKWNTGELPDITRVIPAIYASRMSLVDLPDRLAVPTSAAEAALALPHDYYFVVPLGLAECYHAIGDWPNAEKRYLQAAKYQYINAAIEAPFVWLRLASLYLDWGNSLYRGDDRPGAFAVYRKVLEPNDVLPAASPLYATAGIAPGATLAQQAVGHLAEIIAKPATAKSLQLDPSITALLIEVHQRIAQINAGLDFWGHWAPAVPIWTFDYLHEVAVNYCQMAISVERDVISFWDRADQAALTRLELSQRVSDSDAELTIAIQQSSAASAERDALAQGAALAQTRVTDAAANRADYANLHGQAITYQACATQLGGGDDSDPGEMNALADQYMSGQGIYASHATTSATAQLVAGRLDQQYELASMDRTTAELQSAAAQANSETAAADARVKVAQSGVALATLRGIEASQFLNQFDDATFTPQVWQRMGDAMYALYQRYLDMALRTARMMQSAYNFENDVTLSVIKASYASNEIRGLLAADMLMADVQSFTDLTLTRTRSKPQLIKQTISLAERHSFLFETKLRPTGSMTFETTLEDFELTYPGTYGGRIRSVDVSVEGLVPTTGISGTLTNGGISRYRLPADVWTDASKVRFRIQSAETLVLSDYDRKSEFLDTPDARKLGIFAGAGVASTWRLDLPRAVNDIDFGLVTDVKLTFIYDARFDPQLVGKVKSLIATQPGAHSAQRGVPLRWLYPDLFFRFQDTGELKLTLAAADLPHNQRNPLITSIGVLAIPGPASSGLVVHIGVPGKPPVKSIITADGSLSSAQTSSALAVLKGGSALGEYSISVVAAENPSWMRAGKLDLRRIQNLVLILGYSFTPRN